MTTLTRAELLSFRYTDDEMVGVVRRRLVDCGASAAVGCLDRLGPDERAAIARHERDASKAIPAIPPIGFNPRGGV